MRGTDSPPGERASEGDGAHLAYRPGVCTVFGGCGGLCGTL